MRSGLEVKYHLDEEPAKVWVKAWNPTTSGSSEDYVNCRALADFVRELPAFPTNPADCRSFGNARDSSLFCFFEFSPTNSRGHIMATIKLATDDEPHRSEATIRFAADLASLDSFAHRKHA